MSNNLKIVAEASVLIAITISAVAANVVFMVM